MKVISSSLVAAVLTSASTLANSYYFEDGFEGGDTYSTNPQGFSWGGGNSNSIFNSQGMLWKKDTGTNDPPLTSYSGAGGWTWAKDSNSDWTPRSGSGLNFLNFIYGVNDNWAERRFDMGVGVPDIWVSYWIRVPHNYYMPNNTECDAAGVGDKYFVLWHDDYSGKGDGSTIIWGMQDGGNRNASFNMNHSPGCFNNVGNKKATGECDTLPKPDKEVISGYIKYPSDQGRWMHMVYHARDSSVNGVADGVIETWRRWQGDASYTKLISKQGVQLRSVVGGWHAGYIMGDSGRHYCEQAEWLLDDFIVSDKSLLTTSNPALAAPLPPTGITFQ
jgi:hypothetical protein